MQYEENSRSFNVVVAMALGAIVGAGIALLMAPHSGKRTRRRLMHAVSGVTENAGDRWDDLSDDLRSAISAGRRRFRM